MRVSVRWIGILFPAIAALAACGGDDAPGGGSGDASEVPHDASTIVDAAIDAGMIEIDGGFDDAGNPIDGGMVGADASAEIDAGMIEIDGGLDDAGNAIDGGVIAADASTPSDAGMIAIDGGFDDAGNAVDGGVVAADAGSSAIDGGTAGDGGGDAGSPLGQPLSQFCSGSGAVVEVGGNVGDCSGTVAQNTFRFGLCTCQGVMLQSNLLVDAFDSRLGPYGATTPTGPNILEDGHVGVDGTLSVGGQVDVLGSVFVSGGGFSVGQRSSVSVNVYAAGDAVQSNSFTDVGRHMFVNGSVFGRYDISQNLFLPVGATIDPATSSRVGGMIVRGPISPITPCPCGPSEILDVGAYVDYGALHNDDVATGLIDENTWATGLGPDTITLPCGRYYLTQIHHPRGITIRAEGRTVLYVDGDVILGGGLRLEIAQGAEIDLFIAGSLSLQAASRLGDEVHPSAVRTYVGGSAPIVLGASSLFGGNLYAPNADVVFGASANLYGALFSRNASFSGSANIHFDHAIRSAGDTCAPDGGVPGTDGGASGDGGNADGGTTSGDAGADAGVRDAGGSVGDAGGTNGDAGGTSGDAGSPPDAGPPDSGTCTTCYGCGNQQACFLDVDAGTGVCGPCQSDLDCCPTEICDTTTGRCHPTL